MTTKTERRVDISVLEPLAGPMSEGRISEAWMRNVVMSALDRVLPHESCQLSLAIADDDTIRHLNKDYRGLDEVTDVLSFSDAHPGHWEGEGEPPPQAEEDTVFVAPPLEVPYLGEVVISYPQAVRQAATGNRELEREFALLIVHGVLHLLGFDHVAPSEQAAMGTEEQKILSSIFRRVED